MVMKQVSTAFHWPDWGMGPIALSAAIIASLGMAIIYADSSAQNSNQETPLPGLTAEPLSPSSAGLVVTSVRYQSEAQRAGVVVGDDIISVNDIPATSGTSRTEYLSNAPDGVLRLQLLHQRALRTIVLHPVAR